MLRTCVRDLFTPANAGLVDPFRIFVDSGFYIARNSYVIFAIFPWVSLSSKIQKFQDKISTSFKICILLQNVSFVGVAESNCYLK